MVMVMRLLAVAAGILLVAACGSGGGDTVDRAEVEARDAAAQAEELQEQIDESENDDLLADLRSLAVDVEVRG
jgi:outer membrane murein-binding lipoprotein Lpp